MPASSSGLRRESVWNTNASISMPPPAMIQAIMAPRPPVARPNDEGRAKIPEPIIEPTTSAMSARRESASLEAGEDDAMVCLAGLMSREHRGAECDCQKEQRRASDRPLAQCTIGLIQQRDARMRTLAA